MKLVVGLGNPGRRYQGTRHNLGFVVAGQLVRKYATGGVKSKFQGEVAEADLQGQKALLLTPMTYMNLSGGCVLAARDFYKIPNAEIMVVCDDLNLPVGKLRLRSGGSAGGQKGLEDIIRRLGSDEFPRLRIGIGEPAGQHGWVDHVLTKFSADELPLVEQAVERAVEAVVLWAHEGLEAAMNRYNG